MTVGTPTIIHFAKLSSPPKLVAYCPFKMMSGGVPMSVPISYPLKLTPPIAGGVNLFVFFFELLLVVV